MNKSDQKMKKKGLQEKARSTEARRGTSGSDSASQRDVRADKGRESAGGSRRESEKRKEDKGSILKYVSTAGQFLREARMELRKVKWPTRKELLASTAAVIVLVVVVAGYLFVIDLGVIQIIKGIMP